MLPCDLKRGFPPCHSKVFKTAMMYYNHARVTAYLQNKQLLMTVCVRALCVFVYVCVCVRACVRVCVCVIRCMYDAVLQ